MKTFQVNWLLVALAAAVSCGKENPAGEAEPAGNRLVELHARLGEDTRASVNGTGTVSWEASDEISVWTSADTKKTFSMVSISGGYASFQAYLNIDETPQTLAVYPVRSFGTVSGSTATIVYPYTYTYREGALEAPMAALIEGETIAFRHLGGPSPMRRGSGIGLQIQPGGKRAADCRELHGKRWRGNERRNYRQCIIHEGNC